MNATFTKPSEPKRMPGASLSKCSRTKTTRWRYWRNTFTKRARRAVQSAKVRVVAARQLSLIYPKERFVLLLLRYLKFLLWRKLTGRRFQARNRRTLAKLWRLRLRACLRCPIYNRNLRTCGTPGTTTTNPETREVESEGCYCEMPEIGRAHV